MENLNTLYNLTHQIKTIISQSEFKKNDVRKAYFENLYSIVNEFYTGKVFFKIAQEIKNKTIKFDQSISSILHHVLRIYEIADHPLLANGFHNDLNRSLFIDSFTNFETTITLCFEHIITDNERTEIVRDLNSKIIKITKNLTENEKEGLLRELKKNTFIPIIRKFRYLSKLNENCYSFDINEDLKFIEFCSKLRNCVSHSAGYYQGKNFEYEFENVKFIFKNASFLDMEGINEFVFLKINERLNSIINNLSDCTRHIEFIPYPDDGF